MRTFKKWKTAVLAMALTVSMAMQALAATDIGLNLDWKYAENSAINTGHAILFTTDAPKKLSLIHI